MSAEREEMPMESEENVEKETEKEEDSESSDDSGDEEAADNPRIAELEIQVQNQQTSLWAILKLLWIQKVVVIELTFLACYWAKLLSQDDVCEFVWCLCVF